MPYHKFCAPRLFTGHAMFSDEKVLVTDPAGVILDIVPKQDAGDGIQQLDGVLTPAFVNCHCHLELSHMKGLIPEHTGLVDFVLSILQQRHFPAEEMLNAIATAEAEMLANGIVAVGDICNNALSLPQKRQGALYYYNFIEVSGFSDAIADARFAHALNVYHQFETLQPQNCIGNAIVPHAPYSLSEKLFAKVNQQSKGKLVSIHNQETPAEDAFIRYGKGDFLRLYEKLGVPLKDWQPPATSSLQMHLQQLPDVGNILLVHNTCTTENDISWAAANAATAGRQLFWCLCPNANLYIENQLPPVSLLQQQGCNAVLGTDSLASNHQLSIAAEMYTLQQHFPALELEELLRWATINGAAALGIANRFGSFDTGKQPGIVLLNPTSFEVKRIL